MPLTLLLLLLALSQAVSARSSMGRVQVEQRAGAPCFTLRGAADTERYPSQLAYISVVRPPSRPMARDGEMTWSLNLLQAMPAVQLSSRSCLAYAAQAPGAEVQQAAKPLQPGVAYSVSFNTSLLKPGDDNDGRPYQGDFCLDKDAAGKLAVYDLHARVAPPPGDVCEALLKP